MLQILVMWLALLSISASALEPLRAKVVIVGAGAAGLQAADILREAGIPFIVLEADSRPGGRIFSRYDRGTDLDLVLDEGANLINSTDTVALSLLNRFKIPFVRRIPAGGDAMVYLWQNRILTQNQYEEELFASNSSALWTLSKEQKTRARGNDQALMNRLTQISITEYLQQVEAGPMLVNLLSSFFWSEYGKRLDQLNGHVLHDYFALDQRRNTFKLIPYTDEAYTVPGGTGQIAVRLAKLNRENIRYDHQVTDIESQKDGTVLVTSNSKGGRVQVKADYVVYSAPLYRLHQIHVNVNGLDPAVLDQARKVSYANGVKLHLKFHPGFHSVYKFPGIFVTDTGEQIWISSFGQTSGAGLLTVLTGPMPTDSRVVRRKVRQILAQLEMLAPGVSSYYAGVERTDAPFSYSGAMQPGESNDLQINADHGQWITIGEASGGSLQGYLEGALLSASRRTRELVASCESLLNSKTP